MAFLLRVLVLALVPLAAAQAQIRPGTVSESPRSTPHRPHRAPEPDRSVPIDRCANFRSELRDARRAEREAITTTQSDQASLRRQRLLEQSQRAGC
jgi:hypothetical protein